MRQRVSSGEHFRRGNAASHPDCRAITVSTISIPFRLPVFPRAIVNPISRRVPFSTLNHRPQQSAPAWPASRPDRHPRTGPRAPAGEPLQGCGDGAEGTPPHNPARGRSGRPVDLLQFRPDRLEHFTPERPVNAARRGVVGVKLFQDKGAEAAEAAIVCTPRRSRCPEFL